MLAGLCLFVVCLQLQECVRYTEYFHRHVGDEPLDVFYFENPDDLPIQAHQHDLSEMLVYDFANVKDSSQHLHTTALDWMAYFHYRYNSTCQQLLKFEHDILFLKQKDFDYAEMFREDIQANPDSTLLVYRRGCEDDVITTFNIVVDKNTFMDFLDLYTLNSMLQGSKAYSVSGLNHFIDTYSEVTGRTDFHKTRIERMYMNCKEDANAATELPPQYSFIHCTHYLRKAHPACRAHYAEANDIVGS